MACCTARWAPVAKERALRAFAAGETPVLVATTVVELGIDVPAATVMLIEDADKLGLAQLHQLRGRVGRGTQPGLCFLLASEGLAAASPGMARLEQLAALDDGFRLAEADLAQRGFGDLLGTEQAGASVRGRRGARRTIWPRSPSCFAPPGPRRRRSCSATHGWRTRSTRALARALRETGAVGFAAEAG